MAFECKFYDCTPDVSLGRTFVGLISDCGPLRLKGSSPTSLLTGLGGTFRSVRAPSHFLASTHWIRRAKTALFAMLSKNCAGRHMSSCSYESAKKATVSNRPNYSQQWQGLALLATLLRSAAKAFCCQETNDPL